MNLLIAVDPGKSGGVAVKHAFENCVHVHNMPDTEGDLKDLIDSELQKSRGAMGTTEPIIYMEQVGGFIRGNPVAGSAMFNFGRNYGFVLGLAAGAKIPLRLVIPEKWQKGVEFSSSSTGDERKRALKAFAQRLHPEERLTLKTCDARLILDYALGKE